MRLDGRKCGAGRWLAVPQWDLGIAGLLLLAAMSLAFGLVAHLIVGRHVTRWL